MASTLRAVIRWKRATKRGREKRAQQQESEGGTTSGGMNPASVFQPSSSPRFKNLPAPIAAARRVSELASRFGNHRQHGQSQSQKRIQPEANSLPAIREQKIKNFAKRPSSIQDSGDTELHGIQVQGRRTSFSAEYSNGGLVNGSAIGPAILPMPIISSGEYDGSGSNNRGRNGEKDESGVRNRSAVFQRAKRTSRISPRADDPPHHQHQGGLPPLQRMETLPARAVYSESAYPSRQSSSSSTASRHYHDSVV